MEYFNAFLFGDIQHLILNHMKSVLAIFKPSNALSA